MGGVAKAIGSIFSPKEPKLPRPATMPDPNAPIAKAAAAQKIREKRRFGRAGDIYTGDQAYQTQNLGGTRTS